MTIQPQLWTDRPARAMAFYQQAFGAIVLHLVGDGDDIVVQLAVGEAAFWVASADEGMKRMSPTGIGGSTARFLLVVPDPEEMVASAVDAGAFETAPVHDEYGWRLGRLVDPFGHEWEIGHPTGEWPPA